MGIFYIDWHQPIASLKVLWYFHNGVVAVDLQYPYYKIKKKKRRKKKKKRKYQK